MARYGNVSQAARALGLSRSAALSPAGTLQALGMDRVGRREAGVRRRGGDVSRFARPVRAPDVVGSHQFPTPRLPTPDSRHDRDPPHPRPARAAARPRGGGARVVVAWRCSGRATTRRRCSGRSASSSCWRWSASPPRSARVVVPFQTLANPAGGAARGRLQHPWAHRGSGDPVGAVLIEVNALADTLHRQRLGAVEARPCCARSWSRSTSRCSPSIEQHLRIANRTGERLMNRTVEQMLGRTAEELGVTDWFGESPRVVDIATMGGAAAQLGGAPDHLPHRRAAAICWCSRTSAARCASRSDRHGSG